MLNSPFVKSDELSKNIATKMQLSRDKKTNRRFQKTFHPDELTECGRKLIFCTREINSLQSNNYGEDLTQKYSKLKWIDLLSESDEIKVLDKFVEVSDVNYNIVSEVDCVIKIEDLPVVVLIKSLNSNDFANIVKNGIPRKDAVRIIVDMWLIEIPDSIIIYENRDSLEVKIFHVIPYNAIINAVREKSRILWDCIVNESIVDRPYKDSEKSKECQSCSYKDRCWKNG